MAQYYPGTSKVSENRRHFADPEQDLEKLREISDEDIVKILGHRAPGENSLIPCTSLQLNLM